MQRIEKGRDLDRDTEILDSKIRDFGKLGRPTKCGTKFTRNGKIFPRFSNHSVMDRPK